MLLLQLREIRYWLISLESKRDADGILILDHDSKGSRNIKWVRTKNWPLKSTRGQKCIHLKNAQKPYSFSLSLTIVKVLLFAHWDIHHLLHSGSGIRSISLQEIFMPTAPQSPIIRSSRRLQQLHIFYTSHLTDTGIPCYGVSKPKQIATMDS